MKGLIIGAGEVGRAIFEIVSPHHDILIRDLEDMDAPGVDVLHICFPYSVNFVDQVRDYIEQYDPKFTIIHSSVAIGTTVKCGEHVMNCPVRGRHPRLSSEIPAFKLFIAGGTESDRLEAQKYLEQCALMVVRSDDPSTTEACKLVSNIHMGLEIAWRQELHRMFQQMGLSESIYESWEDSYNLGYRVTNDEQLTRPRLKSDPIGGHCILQCLEILRAAYPCTLFDAIKESNEKTKRSHEPSDEKTPEFRAERVEAVS